MKDFGPAKDDLGRRNDSDPRGVPPTSTRLGAPLTLYSKIYVIFGVERAHVFYRCARVFRASRGNFADFTLRSTLAGGAAIAARCLVGTKCRLGPSRLAVLIERSRGRAA